MQVAQHLLIVGAGGVAAVQQLHQQGVVAGCFKVAVDEVVPALTVGVAHLGVAVAGQVHKVAVVHRIEIDGGRFARRTGHAGKVFAAAQLIDEAGFAHVGPPRKAQLRAVALGQLAGNAVAGNEISFVVIHGAFLSCGTSNPLSLVTSFLASSPEGGALSSGGKHPLSSPLRGSWHGASRD